MQYPLVSEVQCPCSLSAAVTSKPADGGRVETEERKQVEGIYLLPIRAYPVTMRFAQDAPIAQLLW